MATATASPASSAGALLLRFSQPLSPETKPLGPAQQVSCPHAPWGPENTPKRDGLVTPTRNILGCFFPALSTVVMHSGFVGVFV